MEQEKQIDEMAKKICHALNCDSLKNGEPCYKYCKAYIYAFRAQNAGYRKQRKAMWELKHIGNGWDDWYSRTCTACNKCYEKPNFQMDYCPNCGAEMVGEFGA